MKKVLFVALVIVAMFASIAAAPMPVSVTLVGVSNGGGGPMFTFRVDGPVNLNNGVVHSVEGQYQGDFPLFCKQENETTVVCHASKKVSGDWVTVEFGGGRFWVGIPETPNPVEPSYCYGYYELVPNYSGLEADPMGSWNWGKVTNICQDTPAVAGDKSTYNGDPYHFYDDAPFPGQNNYNPGPAYYLDAF